MAYDDCCMMTVSYDLYLLWLMPLATLWSKRRPRRAVPWSWDGCTTSRTGGCNTGQGKTYNKNIQKRNKYTDLNIFEPNSLGTVFGRETFLVTSCPLKQCPSINAAWARYGVTTAMSLGCTSRPTSHSTYAFTTFAWDFRSKRMFHAFEVQANSIHVWHADSWRIQIKDALGGKKQQYSIFWGRQQSNMLMYQPDLFAASWTKAHAFWAFTVSPRSYLCKGWNQNSSVRPTLWKGGKYLLPPSVSVSGTIIFCSTHYHTPGQQWFLWPSSTRRATTHQPKFGRELKTPMASNG